MGLDVSVSLVVGVPLLFLGNINEVRETVPLVSPTGKKTGKTTTLINVYLEALNGERYLMGSNEYNIDSSYWPTKARVEYQQYEGILDTETNEVFRAHWSRDDLTSVVMGIEVESDLRMSDKVTPGLLGKKVTRFEAFKMATPDLVANVAPAVRDELGDRFGYEGEVYAISMAHYSY